VVGPHDLQAAQQIRPDPVLLGTDTGLRTLVDRHEPHQPHQAADPLFIDRMAFGPQMPSHLANAVEWRLRELLVDPAHQRQVQRRLALRRVVEGRVWDRQQVTLLAHTQPGMGAIDHPSPHFPVQGLSFRDKKSLATANSPIFACSSFTVSSSISESARES
jgi:hypothetical protein